ncbi:4-amino-4-deoxy-L-arabinose transferase [Nocardioides sp. zg-DK7169]|nr:4-amino-4-deoxy-L-arabinose transferase [Nocardioides sp. zg-DK7169]
MLDLARSRPARLGSGRLVCLDGPAGSGKSTLAAGLLALAPAAVVVHTDDLLDGWDGLPGLPAALAALVAPLARDEPSSYRRYDWYAACFANRVEVAPGPLLVIEGVGSGTRALDAVRSLLVWVDAPADVRRERWLARDGAASEPHRQRWVPAEQRLFEAEGTRARADLVLDGSRRMGG